MKKIPVNKYRDIPFTARTRCLICAKPMQTALLNFPKLPMTEIYTSEKGNTKLAICDQSFHICKNCGHGQIKNVIDVNLQYGDAVSYSFRASKSATGRESGDFFLQFLNKFIGKKRFGNILELGCNDMYVLQALKNKARKLVGVDPILKNREKEFTQDNLIAIGGFFEDVRFNEKFDMIICKDTLEHVDNPKEFVRKVIELGNDNTLYFFQFPLLETLLYNCRFDQIFHQHLSYFSLQSILYMLTEFGCELVDYSINHNLWGAILIAFKKGKSKQFAKDVRVFSRAEILQRYEIFKTSMQMTQKQLQLLENEILYGYGAALMLPILSYHLNNDFSSFKYILDEDAHKDGTYYINLPVQIRHVSKVHDIQKAVILVTAISTITNTRRILAKLASSNPKKILVPLHTF